MGSMETVHRRRNLAFGIVAAGTSIGGTVFPLIAGSLLPRVGYVFLFPLFEYFYPNIGLNGRCESSLSSC